MILYRNFFIKIIVIAKMLKIIWNLLENGNNSDKHHGVIDVLLELTPREIW